MGTLTPGELLDFTGSSQRNKQKALLEKYGINPLVRTDGSIAVTWEAIEAVMINKKQSQIGLGVKLENV